MDVASAPQRQSEAPGLGTGGPTICKESDDAAQGSFRHLQGPPGRLGVPGPRGAETTSALVSALVSGQPLVLSHAFGFDGSSPPAAPTADRTPVVTSADAPVTTPVATESEELENTVTAAARPARVEGRASRSTLPK
jgi:hypothetical protein